MKEFSGYKKGVNFGGWLSQCDHTTERYDNFIKAEDFNKAKEMGYDHVRVPIDYELIQTEEGEFIEKGFSYIDFAIKSCKAAGLNMVLDLHRTPGFSFDPFHNKTGLFENEELQERFYGIWNELAKRYSKEHEMLCFELLNEVTNHEYQPTWNKMIAKCVKVIREYSKDIRIIVGGYNNSSVEAVRELDEPADENIVYTFHFYEPLIFTHQGAYWIATMDTEFRCPFEMTYKEYDELSAKYLCQAYADFNRYDKDKVIGEEFFETLLSEAISVAEERNVALYCGEFGVIDRASRAEAQKWYDLFYKFMAKYNIASSIWNYKEMDFGIS